MKGDIEVAPAGSDWVVKVQKTKEQIGPVYVRKEDAIAEARRVANERDVEVFYKNADGRIANKDSHGNDPPEVKG